MDFKVKDDIVALNPDLFGPGWQVGFLDDAQFRKGKAAKTLDEIVLYDKQSGALLGIVSDDDINTLIDQLEEEDSADEDYFIDADTIDLLEEGGASETLVSILRKAVGDAEGIDVRYEE